MHGNCCRQKIQNKKIKFSQKLLDDHVKEYTNVEGPTNCKAATSTTRQCNNNDNNNNNNIKEISIEWLEEKWRGLISKQN